MKRKKLKLTASFNIKADVPTINGRIYPKKVLEEMLAAVKDGCVAITDITDMGPIDVRRIKGEVTDLKMVDGYITGEAVVFDPALITLIENKLQTGEVRIAPSMKGNVVIKDGVTHVVDVILRSVDFVGPDDKCLWETP